MDGLGCMQAFGRIYLMLRKDLHFIRFLGVGGAGVEALRTRLPSFRDEDANHGKALDVVSM